MSFKKTGIAPVIGDPIQQSPATEVHTCINTATTNDGLPPPPCKACQSQFRQKFTTPQK